MKIKNVKPCHIKDGLLKLKKDILPFFSEINYGGDFQNDCAIKFFGLFLPMVILTTIFFPYFFGSDTNIMNTNCSMLMTLFVGIIIKRTLDLYKSDGENAAARLNAKMITDSQIKNKNLIGVYCQDIANRGKIIFNSPEYPSFKKKMLLVNNRIKDISFEACETQNIDIQIDCDSYPICLEIATLPKCYPGFYTLGEILYFNSKITDENIKDIVEQDIDVIISQSSLNINGETISISEIIRKLVIRYKMSEK